MPISDVASLIGGAALGAPVSEILKLVIEGAKHVNDFKSLFQDLASRMEVLVPVFKDIESMQQGSNPGEQKVRMIMQRADEMVRKCSSVQPYNLYKRALYTSQIKGINQDFLRFCQIELPLIQYRNQLQSMRLMARVNTQILTLSNGLPLAMNPLPYSISDGCSFTVDHRRSVNVLSVLCHPECLICHACDKPFAIQEGENYVSNSRGKFHESCYVRYCYVCKERKMRKYYQHPIWGERYCHSHETDGTPKCHSCERLEPKGTNFVMLDDGRWLCLECMDSAVMDSDECQPLHFDMREFFEGLHMKIEQQFPLLLVEKQALNKAEEEKINNQDYEYEVVTRGICLSEAQTVTSVSQKPMMGPSNKLVGMATESQRVVRECEVTGILILYGLPRLLTGYILAHEMMHAYLRLNGYRNLNAVLEEGLCQVVGHMWLESQTYATADATEASSSSSPTPAANASKKGEWSDFEKKLVEFCKNQIETDESPVFGAGFRKVNQMVTNSSLQETLKEILRWG